MPMPIAAMGILIRYKRRHTPGRLMADILGSNILTGSAILIFCSNEDADRPIYTAFFKGSGSLLSGSISRRCVCTICLLNGFEIKVVFSGISPGFGKT